MKASVLESVKQEIQFGTICTKENVIFVKAHFSKHFDLLRWKKYVFPLVVQADSIGLVFIFILLFEPYYFKKLFCQFFV